MKRSGEFFRRLIVAAVVATAALVSCGGSAFASAQIGPVAAPTGSVAAPTGSIASPAAASGAGDEAPVAPEVEAQAADGPVDVIAVTTAPGDQVVDAVVAAVPDDSVTAVEPGRGAQVALTVDAAGLESLRRAPYVERIVENGKNYVSADAWAENVGLPATHVAGWNGSGESIAILDSGVEASHPYLAGKVVAEACFSSQFAANTRSLCPGQQSPSFVPGAGAACPSTIPECEHGTHVAGIAVGGPTTDGGRVLEGVASGASIIAVQVFTTGTTTDACNGPAPCLFAYDSDLNDALEWVRSKVVAGAPGFTHLAAVNLSLGGGLDPGTCDDDPTKPYVDRLAALGVVTVAATGNSGLNSAAFPGSSAPACISTVVSVGATTNASTLAGYSNLTAGTTILAPGGPIISSMPGSTFGPLSGTSMSTPVVSGAIALLKQQGYTARSDIVSRLTTTGDEVPTAFGTRSEVELDSALIGVPNSPRQLAAHPDDGSVDVSWSPPSFGGDSPLTGYTVTSFPASAGCVTAGATSCQVTGLTNGIRYTFTVRADGPAGSGSPAYVAATPRTVPGPPRQVALVAGHESVTASWSAPISNGGAPITGYRATALPGGATCATSGGLSCTIRGLTNGTPYTVTVVARNAAGTGSSSSPSGPAVPAWAPDRPAGPPLGSVDSVTPGLRSITVAGWAFDPEQLDPITTRVSVDGVAVDVTADGDRPDVGAVFPRYGSAHGFQVVVNASGGPHTVCVQAIGVGVGGDTSLGCRQVAVPTGPPVGTLDSATVAPGRIAVAGWALDPDVGASIRVVVTIDGSTRSFTANGDRPDVGLAFPGYGSAHGFNRSLVASGGFHAVCAYGVDPANGARSLIGCRWVVVPTGPPVGSLDRVTRSAGTVTVAGWAIDPDTTAPIDVHLVVGAQILPVSASLERPDVGQAYPDYGSAHGYGASFAVSSAPVTVCAYAINVGGGSNVLLGCRAA